MYPLSPLQSVGANGHLELDFAIDRTGSIDPQHALRYKQFGDWIRACYGSPLGSFTLTGGARTAQMAFPSPVVIDRVMLEESLVDGHSVAAYQVEVQLQSSQDWVSFSSGNPIGSKRIDLHGSSVIVMATRITVLDAFAGTTPTVKVSVFAPCQ